MQQAESAAGNIYDLGYRRYEGARLGRADAVLALYLQSLRAAFGLGRRATSKIVPFGLVIIAALPAGIQLGIASIASGDIEFIAAPEYYQYVQVVLALFAAAVAPELVGRDQRMRTLSLYFSRPLTREDYVIAKLAALTTAMLALTLLPQLILFVGNMFAGTDWGGYFQDNWRDLPRILVTAVALSFFVSAIALAVAAQTPKRAFATGGVIALFLITSSVSSILVGTVSGAGGRWSVFLSLYDIMRGSTFWVFDYGSPGEDDPIQVADLPGVIYGIALVVVSVVAAALVFRRYRGLHL